MSAAVLEVSGLTKRFGDHVLDDVELTTRGGELTLVVGGPGSGKSTLARCLTGVYRPDGGLVRYRLAGHGVVDLTGADARGVAWLRAHHLAGFDGPPAVPPGLPAAEAAARAAGCSRAEAVAALARLGADALGSVPFGRLRPAQRHAVGLAAALEPARPFVVLDAPERYADPHRLIRWLQRLIGTGAAVVVTADTTSKLTAIASHTGYLEKGHITWAKP